MYQRLAHTAFRVRDMQSSLKFYCDVLGCKKIFELSNTEGKPWIVYLRIQGSQYVELFYDGNRPFETDDRSIAFMHFCFEVDDVQKMYDQVINAGYKGITAPKKGRDLGDHCMVLDPDGIKVEFVKMHPNAPQLIYHKI